MLVSGLLSAAVVTLAGGAAVGGANSRHRCPPAHAVVQARSRSVVAYRRPGRDPLYGCSLATGRSRVIADDYWYHAPAVAAAGTLIASAVDAGEAAEDHYTAIGIADLARPERRMWVVGFSAGTNPIGSMRVKRNRSLAWIECLAETSEGGKQEPDCVRPGTSITNYVYKRDSRTDTDREEGDLVAEGRDIDPRSLRLHGSTLSWIQGGAPRTSQLR